MRILLFVLIFVFSIPTAASADAPESASEVTNADAATDRALGLLPKTPKKKSVIQQEAKEAAAQQTVNQEVEEINRQQAQDEQQDLEASISERQKTLT